MPLLASSFSDVALPELVAVPGMTSPAECRYLYWLAASQLTGAGCLVEVGSWLGRSTLHIAAGLSRSGYDQQLHCFDGYTWGAGDSRVANLPLKPGESFQRYFEANVDRFSHLVTAHRTQIADIAWSGAPVEFLFLDAPKKHNEITRCLEVFGPSLIPGRSIIAIQDYLYFPAYPLAMCFHLLRDYLELVHVVLDGSTVAFRVVAPLDLARSKPANWNIRCWKPDQIRSAWDSILEPLPAAARERLEPGRALHLYDCGAKREAIAAMRALPMTAFQEQKISELSKSHHYLGYPELFTVAGYPGTVGRNLLSRAKRIRDWLRHRQPAI